jgi:RNA polymerase sigma-70 factor (ECF subfamily)
VRIIDNNHDLINASKAGDTKAMEKLINIHAEAVHSLIYSMLGNRDLVDDIAQETFLRMCIAIKDYEYKASFRSWLFRIAVNLCRDHFRRSRVRRIISNFHHYEQTDQNHIFMDHSQNPLHSLEQKENTAYIHKAIGKLSTLLRTVIILRDIQDMTYEEIANTLNWRLGTVKTRLFRARRQLAEILRPYREELS